MNRHQVRPTSGVAWDVVAKRIVLVMLATLILALAACSVALAADPVEIGSFGGTGTASGSFDVKDVAVNEATGDVYVLDRENDAVDRFNSAGVYQSALHSTIAGSFGFENDTHDHIAVDNSEGTNQGNVYVTSAVTNTIFAFNSSGSELWEASGVGRPCGIAVDASGGLWVSDRNSDELVEHDTSDGSTTTNVVTLEDEPGEPCGLAIAHDGTIYAGGDEHDIDKYTPEGEFVETVEANKAGSRVLQNVFDIAVDPITDHFFAATYDYDFGGTYPQYFGSALRQWDASGTLVSTLQYGGGMEEKTRGLTVDGQRARLYVADRSAQLIRIFSLPTPPTAEALPAAGVSATGAALKGIVNPHGKEVTECAIHYGTTTSYGQSANCSSLPGSGTSDVEVEAAVTGLSPHTKYHYVVVATTVNGTAESEDETLTTSALPPVVSTGSSSGVAQTAATVAGTVNPEGVVATCKFEYGPTTAYGSSAPCSPAPGSGEAPVSVTAALAGLSAATAYHYRIVGSSSGGTEHGQDATFTTLADTCQTNAALCPPPPPPPTCATNPALCPPHEEPKPLKCKKGFKKKKVHGKQKCVKVKKRRHK